MYHGPSLSMASAVTACHCVAGLSLVTRTLLSPQASTLFPGIRASGPAEIPGRHYPSYPFQPPPHPHSPLCLKSTRACLNNIASPTLNYSRMIPLKKDRSRNYYKYVSHETYLKQLLVVLGWKGCFCLASALLFGLD